MVWDTLWLFLTIFIICSQSGDVEGLRAGNIISVILMSGVWLIFLAARYLPTNRWIKGGVISIITGVWTAFSTDVYALVAEQKHQLTLLAADFTDWATDLTVNANIYLIILILGIVLGVLLLAIGMIKPKRNNR